jgi:hypothetical protein
MSHVRHSDTLAADAYLAARAEQGTVVSRRRPKSSESKSSEPKSSEPKSSEPKSSEPKSEPKSSEPKSEPKSSAMTFDGKTDIWRQARQMRDEWRQYRYSRLKAD